MTEDTILNVIVPYVIIRSGSSAGRQARDSEQLRDSMSFMPADRDQAGGPCNADGICDADWAVIGAGLNPEEFAALRTEARRMALVERSTRFAIEFGRWKDAARIDGIGYEQMRLLQTLNFGGPAIMREIRRQAPGDATEHDRHDRPAGAGGSRRPAAASGRSPGYAAGTDAGRENGWRIRRRCRG